MLYIKRKFPRRYKTGRKPWWKLAAVLLILAILGVLGAEMALSAVSPDLIQEAARGYVLDSVSQAVEQELEAHTEPFVHVEREANGQVNLVSANPDRLNALKAGVLERLSKSLRGQVTVYVPAGSLTGVGLFNGRGFPVPVKLQLEGSATVEFSTDFISAGVNQTCHRLTMTVYAQVYSQSRRFETSAQAQTSTVLAENLVVGEVPKLVTGSGSSQNS